MFRIKMLSIKLYRLVYFNIVISVACAKLGYSDKCEKNIYSRCNHQSEFTHQEIETARIWIQNYQRELNHRFNVSILRPPCRRIYVRKDFKCLTESERMEFIRVIKILYEKGVMDRFTDIHQRYWAEVHKGAQLGPWHRWFVNELEKEMRKINANITIPYYNAQTDGYRPEKSILWKYLGQSGIHYNGWCVRDGMYAHINSTRCVRRQWNNDGSIPPIDGPELTTIFIQLTKQNFLTSNFLQSGLHFLTHLAVGGYNGDMSVDSAPNDILFYLWHNYQLDLVVQKLQLVEMGDPRQYNQFIAIDQATGLTARSDCFKDVLSYYRVPVLEAWQFGFGELCSIHDQIIIAANQKVRNETVVSLAVQRMPLPIKALFYPKFLSGHFDAFSHVFEDVGDCNQKCRPIPQFQPYVATENGRRQLMRYAYDENVDGDLVLILSQAYHSFAIKTMNKMGYCSPYVLS